MLVQLSVRDIILAECFDVTFERGLNVITGETGSGKSLIPTALAFVLGAKGRGSLVRSGVDRGQVTASFHLPADHESHRILAEHEIGDEEFLVVRRIQFSDGRTRAFVNDCSVSAGLLRILGEVLLETHGQHGAYSFMDVSKHRDFLDAFGGLESDVQIVREAWEALESSRSALLRCLEKSQEIERDRAYLEHMCEELNTLAPQIGEEDVLAQRRSTMMQAEKVVEDLRALRDLLNGEPSCFAQLLALSGKLDRAHSYVPEILEAPIQSLERVITEISELNSVVQEALAKCAFDSGTLEQVEERLFALRALARKHHVTPQELPELWEKTLCKLEELHESANNEKVCRDSVAAAESNYRLLASALSAKRRACAAKLDEAILHELAPLKLGNAHFITQLDVKDSVCTAHGFDQVQFLVQTNPGSRLGPIQEVVSGGELSRFVLALKVVFTDCDSVQTLIFDEADAGVGGAVADAIGQHFAKLSKRVQVIAVTHAPQVAARADCHFCVSKFVQEEEGDSPGHTVLQIQRLDHGKREEEIARMLSGARVTDEARAQARRLLSAVG